MAVRQLRRAFSGDETGITLIEVVMAIFILSVALLALGSVAISSLASLRDTRSREQASNAVSAAIEDVRSRDFNDIYHASGSIDPALLPASLAPSVATDTCFGLDAAPSGERLVFDVGTDPIPFERVTGDADTITVHVLVTFEGAACGSSDQAPLKRITAVGSWTDGPNERVVIQETMVTDVARGLPVPRFELRPEDGRVRFSENFLNGGGDLRRCVEHQLRNLGAEDSYDWAVEPAYAGQLVSSEVSLDGYRLEDAWLVSAYLETPPPASRDGEPPATEDDRFTFEAGFDRPVSDARVGAGDSALITVCYQPRSGIDVADLPASVDARIVLRSRFDDRQIEELHHEVVLADPTADSTIPGDPLYLFEEPDDTAHPRSSSPGVMGPLAPDGSDPNVVNLLSTHDYEDTTKANWSTDVVTTDDLPGVRLRTTATPPSDPALGESTAIWHYQFGSGTTLERDVTVVLWLAPPAALQGSIGGDGIPVAGQLHLDELKSNETPVSGGWTAVQPFEYLHTTSQSAPTKGWQRVEIPVDLGDARKFSNNRYLRFRLTCVDAADSALDDTPPPADCNVAYDNHLRASAVYVQER
ncbi:MAG: hypothetical protein WD638_04640 [Nitriliruptoraceae bacterium]